jgi:Leucine-rich repeat (LRR) protein
MRKFILLFITIIFLVSCQKDDDNIENEVPPFLTDAGNDFLNVEEFKVKLNAETLKSSETGIWKIHSGLIDDKVFFDDHQNPKTVFHGLPDEEYKLVWDLTNESKTASDTITVSFSPMKLEISNISPDFYKTRLHLQVNSYDKGKWTIEGNYHKIWNQSFGGTVIPDEESPNIKFYGFENTSYKLTWTTWYGSKSASATVEFESGEFQQDEVLEDLGVSPSSSRYQKDNDGNIIFLHMGGDGYGWRIGSLEHYPSVKALKHLKKLYLYGDGFYHFPEVISSHYLNLEFLDFSGNAISNLPDNIGNLIKLDTLILNNPQDSKRLKKLPDSFGDLKSLKYIDLTGMGLESLPDSFGDLTSLVYIDLDGNIINKLPENFGNLKNLETFRGPGILESIPNSFSNLEKLKFCFFYINSDSAILPTDFGKLKNLETLWLFGKYQSLPDSFGNLENLKKLEITGGSLINQLPENFGNLINLEGVRIFGNFTTLPDSFSNLTNLKNLQLNGNLEYLPANFGNLKNLEWLSINSNNLKKIPDSFGNLENLKIFKASQNNITIIPNSFGDLPKISKIDLSYNHISQFPTTISNLSDSLYDLIIRGNNYSENELNSLKQMLPSTSITSN